jgi:hypothetical protein
VQGKIFAEPDTDEIILPAVRTAHSFHAGRVRCWTRTIDLSSLETLTQAGFGLGNTKLLEGLSLPALRSIAGTFALAGNQTGRTSTQWVDAPLLERIEGSLVLSSHEALQWIDFSSLTYLAPTGRLEIEANEMLPACYATDVLDRLRANGWNGDAIIGGNNGSGTCP